MFFVTSLQKVNELAVLYQGLKRAVGFTRPLQVLSCHAVQSFWKTTKGEFFFLKKKQGENQSTCICKAVNQSQRRLEAVTCEMSFPCLKDHISFNCLQKALF